MVETINGIDFKNIIADTDTAVVDFWAEWCGPCKAISPILEEIESKSVGKMKFFKINVDMHPNVASEYGVESIPTLLFFKKGVPIKSVVGLMPRNELEKHILSVVD
ncbi:MAG: thioredoxin [Candidatus Parvarchaeota archaeon]|nr:thioredoxin [Candidatus Parvarchaeota archaeon]